MTKHIKYADDDKVRIFNLLKIRFPSLFIGLILGIVISFVVSRFEDILQSKIQLVFFLPFVVYIADAIGTQTQSIYSRELKTGKANFKKYLIKESLIGLFIGLLFGLFSALVGFIWFNDIKIAMSVGISMLLAIFSAPIFSLIITQIIYKLREDPAAGSGPIATVIQDLLSVLIYGIISSLIAL